MNKTHATNQRVLYPSKNWRAGTMHQSPRLLVEIIILMLSSGSKPGTWLCDSYLLLSRIFHHVSRVLEANPYLQGAVAQVAWLDICLFNVLAFTEKLKYWSVFASPSATVPVSSIFQNTWTETHPLLKFPELMEKSLGQAVTWILCEAIKIKTKKANHNTKLQLISSDFQINLFSCNFPKRWSFLP